MDINFYALSNLTLMEILGSLLRAYLLKDVSGYASLRKKKIL